MHNTGVAEHTIGSSISMSHYSQNIRDSFNCSRRLLWLIVWPIADCHDWLHNQLQTAMTGCMTNCRLPQLVAWPTADCHDSLRVAQPLLRVAWPLLACPLQEEPGGYLHVHSLAFQQPLLLRTYVTFSPFPCLSWVAFLQHCSVRKLKEYSYWCLIECLFICEGRLVAWPVVRLRNWLWLVTIGHTTSHDVIWPVTWPIVWLDWPKPFVDHHDWWHDWLYNNIWPVCNHLKFGITKPEFWTSLSTLLQIIYL